MSRVEVVISECQRVPRVELGKSWVVERAVTRDRCVFQEKSFNVLVYNGTERKLSAVLTHYRRLA